jgi:methionine-rich copper-binding protein CopC
MMSHRSSRTVVCALLLAAVAATARAHAFLDHAEPRVGSTVATSPSSVTLSFTEPIEPSFSRIDVSDAQGRRIDTGKIEHPAPDRLNVTLPALSVGTYTVHWAVTSVDTHQTEGKFQFTVAAP